MKPGVCCFGRDLGMPGTSPEPTTTYPWHTSWPYTTGAPPLAPCGEECLVPVSHLKKSNIDMSLFFKEGTKCRENDFEAQTNKIINGEEIDPYSWPFAARMKFNGFSGCAGTIVNEDFILTAAHCWEKYSQRYLFTISINNTLIWSIWFQSPH